MGRPAKTTPRQRETIQRRRQEGAWVCQVAWDFKAPAGIRHPHQERSTGPGSLTPWKPCGLRKCPCPLRRERGFKTPSESAVPRQHRTPRRQPGTAAALS